MNLTQLHIICKSVAYKCYCNYIHSLTNLPFETDNLPIKDVLEFEIHQQFGGKVLKVFLVSIYKAGQAITDFGNEFG